MDNEMKNKVNEALKAHGMKELSLDEMDRVSGGMSVFGHEVRTLEDVDAVCALAQELENIFGTDVVAGWIAEETGDQYTIGDYQGAGVDGLKWRLDSILKNSVK